MALKDKIRELRGKRSQEDFAKLIGDIRQNIARYESGANEPRSEFYKKVKKKFGINIDWFFDDKAPMNTEVYPLMVAEKEFKSGSNKNIFRKVPRLGYADCGLPAAQWETAQRGYIVITGLEKYQHLFSFKAHGDSMIPYINKGDELLCAEVSFDKIPDHTAIVIVYKSSPDSAEANAKMFYRIKGDDDNIVTYSINTKYPPSNPPISLDSIDKIYKLVRIIRDVT